MFLKFTLFKFSNWTKYINDYIHLPQSSLDYYYQTFTSGFYFTLSIAKLIIMLQLFWIDGFYCRLQCTKLFWTAGPRPVEIATVQSIPVAVGPPCPVGKAFAVRYWLYFILPLVPGIKISIHGFPPQASMTSGRCLL